MPDAFTPSPFVSSALMPSVFLETIIAFLMPYFSDSALHTGDARSEIIDTLASYATRTRTEMLRAAHIIAFGMTTLEILGEAKTVEMSVSMRLRYRTCANGLNRAMLHSEKSLDRSLACEGPAPTPQPMHEPINDLHETVVHGAIEAANATIATYRNRLAGPPAAVLGARLTTTAKERDERIWAGAMMETLLQMGIPVRTGQTRKAIPALSDQAT